MRRVAYHLTDRQIEALKALSEKTGLPVAELIRRAVDVLLEKPPKHGGKKGEPRT